MNTSPVACLREQPEPVDRIASAVEPAPDCVVIRGRHLALSALVDARLFDPSHRAVLGAELRNAGPFPHLVTDGWFNPVLLELIREEFDLYAAAKWKVIRDEQQEFYRSTTPDGLGPASQIYFDLVNSGWFVTMLGEITGIDDLLGDPRLFGGGLHETKAEGKFGVHRDFDRHALYGLDNKLVLMTYLNADWNPEWGASLEIWDADERRSVRQIVPELGRTVLLMHGPKSFHGHPEPMNAPAGRSRRSVATYYYRNSRAVQQRLGRVSSVFLLAYRAPRFKRALHRWTPPIVLDALKRLIGK